METNQLPTRRFMRPVPRMALRVASRLKFFARWVMCLYQKTNAELLTLLPALAISHQQFGLKRLSGKMENCLAVRRSSVSRAKTELHYRPIGLIFASLCLADSGTHPLLGRF